MEKLKPKISKKVKKVLSSVLAATLVLGSVPASTFLGDAIQVRAAASYSPQKYGVHWYGASPRKRIRFTAVFTTMLVW